MKFPLVSRWRPTMAMHGFYVQDGRVGHRSRRMRAGLATDIVMQRMWHANVPWLRCMLVRWWP